MNDPAPAAAVPHHNCAAWTLTAPLRLLFNPRQLYTELPAGACFWVGSLLLLLVGVLIGKAPGLVSEGVTSELGLSLAHVALSIAASTLALHLLAKFLLRTEAGLIQTSALMNYAFFFLALKAVPVFEEQQRFALVVFAEILIGIRYLYRTTWVRAVLTLLALVVAFAMIQRVLLHTVFEGTPIAEPLERLERAQQAPPAPRNSSDLPEPGLTSP